MLFIIDCRGEVSLMGEGKGNFARAGRFPFTLLPSPRAPLALPCLACVRWRFWLGVQTNKGGRGQRNRERRLYRGFSIQRSDSELKTGIQLKIFVKKKEKNRDMDIIFYGKTYG